MAKHVCQTLDLRLIFRENIRCETLRRACRKIVGQQRKVLIESGLRRCRKVDHALSRATRSLRAVHQHHRLAAIGDKEIARHHTLIDLRHLVPVAEQSLANVVHSAHGVQRVIDPIVDLRACKFGHRNTCLLHLAQVGNDLDAVQSLLRQLRRDLERTDRIDLIAEEIDTERAALRVRKQIDNTATTRVLSRLIDEINALETSIFNHLD